MKSYTKPINTNKSNYIDPISHNDPTFINYLALATAILDPEKREDMRFYLKGLFDKEESDERMQQIDILRELGAGTKLDHDAWLEKFKKESKRSYVGARRIKVINPAAGTEEIFPSINSMCEEYEFKKKNVRSIFHYRKSNKIQYKGLILEKL